MDVVLAKDGLNVEITLTPDEAVAMVKELAEATATAPQGTLAALKEVLAGVL